MKMFGYKLSRFFVLLLNLVFFIANCTSNVFELSDKNQKHFYKQGDNYLEQSKFKIKNESNKFKSTKAKIVKKDNSTQEIYSTRELISGSQNNNIDDKSFKVKLYTDVVIHNPVVGNKPGLPTTLHLSFTKPLNKDDDSTNDDHDIFKVELRGPSGNSCGMSFVTTFSNIPYDTVDLFYPITPTGDANGTYTVKITDYQNSVPLAPRTIGTFQIDNTQGLTITAEPQTYIRGTSPYVDIITTSKTADFMNFKITGPLDVANPLSQDVLTCQILSEGMYWTPSSGIANGTYKVEVYLKDYPNIIASTNIVVTSVPSSPSPTPTVTSQPTSSATPSPSPSSSTSPSPSVEPSSSPTSSPEPSTSPTSNPTPTPTNSSSPTPSPSPSSSSKNDCRDEVQRNLTQLASMPLDFSTISVAGLPFNISSENNKNDCSELLTIKELERLQEYTETYKIYTDNLKQGTVLSINPLLLELIATLSIRYGPQYYNLLKTWASNPSTRQQALILATRIRLTMYNLANGFYGLSNFQYARKYGFGSYNILKKLASADFKSGVIPVRLETHHLIEQRFAQLFNVNPNTQMLCINLTDTEHQIFTNAWRNLIPYGSKTNVTPQQVLDAAREVYKNYPEILHALGLN